MQLSRIVCYSAIIQYSHRVSYRLNGGKVVMNRLCLSLLLLLVPQLVWAAGWQVIPIRLDLGVKAKSGVIRIVNNDDSSMPLQMSAVEWTQDENGKDIYTPTEDLLFFPRIMTVEAQSERVIRVGIRKPALDNEKTYRLFIEQIPVQSESTGAQVAVAIKFGVPIFVTPPKKIVSGELDSISLSNGDLVIPVNNSGNSYFRINTITARGLDRNEKEIFTESLTGWYLLHGVGRTHQLPVPAADCRNIVHIDVEVITDQQLKLNKTLPVTADMCGQ